MLGVRYKPMFGALHSGRGLAARPEWMWLFSPCRNLGTQSPVGRFWSPGYMIPMLEGGDVDSDNVGDVTDYAAMRACTVELNQADRIGWASTRYGPGLEISNPTTKVGVGGHVSWRSQSVIFGEYIGCKLKQQREFTLAALLQMNTDTSVDFRQTIHCVHYGAGSGGYPAGPYFAIVWQRSTRTLRVSALDTAATLRTKSVILTPFGAALWEVVPVQVVFTWDYYGVSRLYFSNTLLLEWSDWSPMNMNSVDWVVLGRSDGVGWEKLNANAIFLQVIVQPKAWTPEEAVAWGQDPFGWMHPPDLLYPEVPSRICHGGVSAVPAVSHQGVIA